MMMEPQIEVGNAWLDNRMTWNTFVVGRIKPGVTPAQAGADLNTIAAELTRQFPVENDRLHFKLSKPGLIGDFVGAPARAFTLGVLLLAALVLLAACTNLASMLTARATDRQREFAIRLAIGADRGRVFAPALDRDATARFGWRRRGPLISNGSRRCAEPLARTHGLPYAVRR